MNLNQRPLQRYDQKRISVNNHLLSCQKKDLSILLTGGELSQLTQVDGTLPPMMLDLLADCVTMLLNLPYPIGIAHIKGLEVEILCPFRHRGAHGFPQGIVRD